MPCCPSERFAPAAAGGEISPRLDTSSVAATTRFMLAKVHPLDAAEDEIVGIPCTAVKWCAWATRCDVDHDWSFTNVHRHPFEGSAAVEPRLADKKARPKGSWWR